jgi:hypothetical protein
MKVPGTFSAVAALPPTQQRIPPHVWLMAAALMEKEKQRQQQENGNAPNGGAMTEE